VIFFNKILSVVLGVIIGGIGGALAGVILGAIGSACNVGGKLIGGLLGAIVGGGLGALFGIFVNGMLASSIGIIGAAELVLAVSFGLFKLFSSENKTTFGEGRVTCLVLIWLAAIAMTVGAVTLPNKTDSLPEDKNSAVQTFTLDAQSENGAAKIFQIHYGKEETVISVIRTTGSHKAVNIAKPGEANSFFCEGRQKRGNLAAQGNAAPGLRCRRRGRACFRPL
jgi:hypothetical protein